MNGPPQSSLTGLPCRGHNLDGMGKSKGQNARRAGRKVRVDFRANRNQPSRAKDWTRLHRDGQEIETSAVENVATKGDLSRKRTVIVSEDRTADGEHLVGTVIALRGQFAEVDDGQRVQLCTIRRVLRTRLIHQRAPVTVGDRVRFRPAPDKAGEHGEGVIEKVEPRRSELIRFAGRREHVVAANIDQAMIVSSADLPPPKPHLIDRYIISALAGRMRPVVCMNKIDLDAGGQARQIAAMYASIGYGGICTSAASGEGIDAFREVFHGKSTVLAGQSGVGKSSLLNAVQPGLGLRVGDICEETAKGRHTTTTAQLLRLEMGAYVVDTPGVRSFDVTMIPAGHIEQHFEEFVPFIPDCKFADCTHRHETGCAVKQAVESGAIHPLRHESYTRLYDERFDVQSTMNR